jgi:hypothetical protein
MDDRRLTELFHEAADSAAHQAPPASFDHADVVAGSRRAEQRARRLRTGAVAAAVLGVAVAGAASAGVLRTSSTSPNSPTALAGPPALSSPRAENAPGNAQPYGTQAGPRTADPFAAKRAGEDSCAVPDQQLFDQLSELVPVAHGATPRALSDEAYCPDGGRGVEVDVRDGPTRGVLRVVLSPPGSLGGGSNVQTGGGSESTTTVTTHNGGSLSLTTKSAGEGSAPFENQIDGLADQLAARD